MHQFYLHDQKKPSNKSFKDGGQYRIEIPSTETPEAFRLALDGADRIGCPIHRVSQGSGIQMLSDSDIKEFVSIGADRCIEVCLFTTPRAGFDTGGLWNAPAGKFVQWQVRGADQLRYSIDEIKRAVDFGIRSVLLADFGLIDIVSKLRATDELPTDLIIKSSAVLTPSNPHSCAILENLGANTINVATDLSIEHLSTIRQAIDAPIDMYVEAPDGLGGFVRHHEVPEMIHFAAPLYIKIGLRNSPDIYPYGKHLESVALRLTSERVRRSKLVYDLIKRRTPELTISPMGEPVADLGIPQK